jgi:hypothetical protein
LIATLLASAAFIWRSVTMSIIRTTALRCDSGTNWVNALGHALINSDGCTAGIRFGTRPGAPAKPFINCDGIGMHVLPFKRHQLAYPQASTQT